METLVEVIYGEFQSSEIFNLGELGLFINESDLLKSGLSLENRRCVGWYEEYEGDGITYILYKDDYLTVKQKQSDRANNRLPFINSRKNIFGRIVKRRRP